MENTWQRFIQDLELSKHYPQVYMLSGSSGMRNPLLENLLPSFLFVRLVSLLDEGLKSYIIAENLGRPQRGDLHHRIEFLAGKDRLKDKVGLLGLKDRRNDVAHESQPAYVDWHILDEAMSTVEREFQHLGLVGTRPKYEFFSSKSAARSDDDPKVAFAFDYTVGLKKDGALVISFNWTEKIYQSGA